MPAATFGFLGNPESVQVGSGSYAIPTGKYGFATGCAINGNVTINGNTWLQSSTVISQQATASSNTVSLTVTTSGLYSIITGSSTTTTLSSLTILENSGTNGGGIVVTGVGGTIYLEAGDVINAVFAASANNYIKIVGRTIGEGTSTGSIWLEAGDTINTTGSSTYAVSIFPA